MGDRGSGSNMNLSVDDYEIDDMFYAGKSTSEGGRRRRGPGPGPGTESVVPAHVLFSDGEVKDLVDCVDRYGRRWADIKRDYRFADSPRSSHSLMMKWDQLAKAAKTGGFGDNLMDRIREIDARRP